MYIYQLIAVNYNHYLQFFFGVSFSWFCKKKKKKRAWFWVISFKVCEMKLRRISNQSCLQNLKNLHKRNVLFFLLHRNFHLIQDGDEIFFIFHIISRHFVFFGLTTLFLFYYSIRTTTNQKMRTFHSSVVL
jgi:hypothetical protein